jgi:hypothetical protein
MTMPDAMIPQQTPYYQSISCAYLPKSVAQLMTIEDWDRGDDWARDRRFGHRDGGKYLSNSTEGAVAEAQSRIRRAAITGLDSLPSDALEEVAVFEVRFQSDLSVMSVIEANRHDNCRNDFVAQYDCQPDETIAKDTPEKSLPASQAVARRVKDAGYEGIEFPSVRRHGAKNLMVFDPLTAVDLSMSPNNPVHFAQLTQG